MAGSSVPGTDPYRQRRAEPETVGLGSFAAITLRSGGAILVCNMVNCKKVAILQEKPGYKEQNTCIFFLMISIKK